MKSYWSAKIVRSIMAPKTRHTMNGRRRDPLAGQARGKGSLWVSVSLCSDSCGIRPTRCLAWTVWPIWITFFDAFDWLTRMGTIFAPAAAWLRFMQWMWNGLFLIDRRTRNDVKCWYETPKPVETMFRFNVYLRCYRPISFFSGGVTMILAVRNSAGRYY